MDIVTLTREKFVYISKVRTEDAIVGTTLHAHVIHRENYL